MLHTIGHFKKLIVTCICQFTWWMRLQWQTMKKKITTQIKCPNFSYDYANNSDTLTYYFYFGCPWYLVTESLKPLLYQCHIWQIQPLFLGLHMTNITLIFSYKILFINDKNSELHLHKNVYVSYFTKHWKLLTSFINVMWKSKIPCLEFNYVPVKVT